MFNIPDLQVILKLVAPGSKSLQIESFEDKETNNLGIFAKLGGLVFLLIFFVAFFSSFGAARLSWCLSTYKGHGTGLSILYALLAFWFSGVYYPLYAFFLNPLCDMRTVAAPVIGGKRR